MEPGAAVRLCSSLKPTTVSRLEVSLHCSVPREPSCCSGWLTRRVLRSMQYGFPPDGTNVPRFRTRRPRSRGSRGSGHAHSAAAQLTSQAPTPPLPPRQPRCLPVSQVLTVGVRYFEASSSRRYEASPRECIKRCSNVIVARPDSTLAVVFQPTACQCNDSRTASHQLEPNFNRTESLLA